MMLSLPRTVTEVGIGSGLSADILQLALHAGMVVKLVLLILLLFSVFSWAIIIVKYRVYRTAERESKIFLDHFWSSRNFSKAFMEAKRLVRSPVAAMFKSGYVDLEKIKKERVQPNPSREPLNSDAQRKLSEEVACNRPHLEACSGSGDYQA